MIRVLVVDDNAIFRQGMGQLVDSVPDFELSAVAGDGASGVDTALGMQVDIVLMDLAMPGISGIDATRKPAAAAPHIGVIAMTMLEDDDMVVQALRAGARGYLVKGATQSEILDSIRGVHARQAVIGTDVARRLGGLVGGPAPADPFPDLTGREREILNLLASGSRHHPDRRPSRAIPKIVRNHLSSIFTKMPSIAPRPSSKRALPDFHEPGKAKTAASALVAGLR
jgi:DNA-binding NarL/FixJ family response regulator